MGGRAGAGAAGSARTWLTLRPWRPDSGQGGAETAQACGAGGRPSPGLLGSGRAGMGRPVWLRRPGLRPGASRGGAEAGPCPGSVVTAPTVQGGVRDALEGSPASLLFRGAVCSSSSWHHPQYTPPVPVQGSAERCAAKPSNGSMNPCRRRFVFQR